MAKKRTAVNIIIAIIVIVFLMVVIGLISIDGILRSAIQSSIQKQLGVGGTVSKVSLKMLSGTVEITNLKINNPKGYQFENVLEAKSIFVKTSIGNLLSNPVEIQQIKINGILMAIEQKGLSTNINEILKGMPKTEEEPAEPNTPGKKVHITSLDINDISVMLKLIPIPGKTDAMTLTIDSLQLSDLGGDNTNLAQVIGKIFTEIANAAIREGRDIIPSDLIAPIQDAVNQRLGNISEEGKKVFEDTEKGIQEKATETLKGIFKKQD
ncbi:MAG: hypothetical protein A2Y10_12755 [Planctomycetes bacterium GWF2_41_51]|nr:MAG: hypothetical protein A2Y10_12755 [Planctomycetes bacterium GWF2_41_51]HBG27308.1 hypothetical protein [Phycisphaerales bacterium]